MSKILDADVADPDDIRRVVDDAVESHGRIDIYHLSYIHECDE